MLGPQYPGGNRNNHERQARCDHRRIVQTAPRERKFDGKQGHLSGSTGIFQTARFTGSSESAPVLG